jgi:chromosome segregation ATPase
MVFKPLLQQISDSNNHSLELDPAVVASNFGVAYPPNQPLPDSGLPERHVEDDQLDVVTDQRKPPKQKQPASLLTLALTRLRSLQPQSPERARQVEQAIANITAPLKAVDDLVAVLEKEHHDAIATRWDELRVQGRKISEGMDALTGEVNRCMMRVNDSEAAKVRAKTRLQAHHESASKMSRWASEEEIAAAEKLVAADRISMQEATDVALAAQKVLAEAQNKVAIAQAQILGIQREMDRCEAELKGQSYHDPELGLSKDPVFYRDSW